MPRLFVALLLSTTLTVSCGDSASTLSPRSGSETGQTKAHTEAHHAAARSLGRVPTVFVPNIGQWAFPAHYVAELGPVTTFLHQRGWTVSMVQPTEERVRGIALRMTFEDASEAAELVPEQRLAGHHNYFLGNDPSKWRSEVPLYASLLYRGMYPDVDVRMRAHDGHFEYDLLLAPSGALDQVVIQIEGADDLRVNRDGALVMDTMLGKVLQPLPRTWEVDRSGAKRAVDCRYVLLGGGRVGFAAPNRTPGCELVVDPGLIFSTFVGGSDDDDAFAVGVDANGAITVAGRTSSPNFPTTPGAFDRTLSGGVYDAFVTRLSPTGTNLVYSTYLGGDADESARCLSLHNSGGTTVGGDTNSTNFPTTLTAFDTSHNGLQDAFVTRISPSGTLLAFSTYLGGAADDSAACLARDALGEVTVAGFTASSDFPTTAGALQTTSSTNGDGFVTRLAASGASLAYSTYLGGTDRDQPVSVAVDATGAATVTGQTQSLDFPTTAGAYDTTFNGAAFDLDAFVTRLSPSGTSLLYSTFLGGANLDFVNALVLDSSGAATVTGGTRSANFPISFGAFDISLNGPDDAFVTRLSPSGASLIYSTYLGGNGSDSGDAIAVDPSGAATICGNTDSTDFPTTSGAFTTSPQGNIDAFVTRLSASGEALDYSTLLGGSNDDRAFALTLNEVLAATVVGFSVSTDFPTTAGCVRHEPQWARGRVRGTPRLAADGSLGRRPLEPGLHRAPRDLGDVHATGRERDVHNHLQQHATQQQRNHRGERGATTNAHRRSGHRAVGRPRDASLHRRTPGEYSV